MGTKEIYNDRLNDPHSWLDMAKKHLISARCLETRIKEIIEINSDIEEQYEKEFHALTDSCLYLVGIALENAIKGFIVSRKQSEDVNIESINTILGHNITNSYEKYLVEIYNKHKDYLSRIQEYVYWIGKYHIPTKPKYMLSSTEFWSDDVDTATIIIELIESKMN